MTEHEPPSRRNLQPYLTFVRIFLFVVAIAWNVLFAMAFVFALPGLVVLLEGDGTTAFVAGWIVLSFLPVAFIVALVKGGYKPATRMFLGFQAPLVMGTMARLLIARDGTWATNLFSLVCLIGFLTFIGTMVWPTLAKRFPRTVAVGWSAALVASVWLGLLCLLYTPPSAVGILKMLFMGRIVPFTVLAFLIPVLTTPFSLVLLYPHSWWQHLRAHDAGVRTLGSAAPVAMVAMIAMTSQQGHTGTLEALAPGVQTPEEIRSNEADLKTGLLDIALWRYRYIGARGKVRPLEPMYESTMGLAGVGRAADAAHALLLKPFLFDGAGTREERVKAGQFYQEIFDANIEADNRAAFRRALDSTWDRRNLSANLLEAGSNSVRLVRQEVSVREDGPVAEIELHETYVNLTDTQREVFYTLELPEMAVLTGLWLGPEAEKAKAFKYRVSPRGAAQEVYNRQKARRVDPALLEQVGPRQYRLRVFPVEPRRGARRLLGAPVGPAQNLWVQYRTLPVDGVWPLPHLLEARNVFWDWRTELSVNGEEIRRPEMEHPSAPDGLAWLPASIEPKVSPPAPGPVSLNGHRVQIEAVSEASAASVEAKTLVVLDTSYSMHARAADVRKALGVLQLRLPEGSALVLARSPFLPEASEQPKVPAQWAEVEPVYFGSLSLGEMGAQAQARVAEVGAEAIIVLTDEGNAAHEPTHLGTAVGVPVWFVHLGGRPATAYDDRFIEALARIGGGVALSTEEVLRRMANPSREADGYQVRIAEVSSEDRAEGGVAHRLRPLAAKLLIEREGPKAFGVPERLQTWHQLAVTEGIVTPFSSMIVLVNEAQHRQLDAAEARKDRFEREVESGTSNNMVPPKASQFVATPEPGTWLMLLAGLALIFAFRYRQLRLARTARRPFR